ICRDGRAMMRQRLVQYLPGLSPLPALVVTLRQVAQRTREPVTIVRHRRVRLYQRAEQTNAFPFRGLCLLPAVQACEQRAESQVDGAEAGWIIRLLRRLGDQLFV